jgi:hypothetical protein
MSFSALTRKPKDKRRSPRKKVSASAWIRLNGDFAVRPCKVHDISHNGVLIIISRGETVSNEFIFMMSRDGSSSRRARVKWRRGTEIGAEFI